MNSVSKTNNQVRTIVPACSITEGDDSVQLRIELPGVPKENIEVQVESDELIIIGKPNEAGESGTYLLRERRPGEYRKVFTIDQTIDRDRIGAVYNNGIMQLTLHLKEAVKPRRIEISAG